MPKLYLEVDPALYLRSKNLTINPHKEAMSFDPLHFELFDAPIMQALQSLINSNRKIKNGLNEIEEQIKQDSNARKYLNIINKRVQLSENLDKNTQHIKIKIKEVLKDNSLKQELRRLPEWSVWVIDVQKQLTEKLSEEKISEAEAKRLNTKINHELDRLCSETIRELYVHDVQVICFHGISAPVIPYLKNLSRLYMEIYKEIEDKVDNYFIESAEQQIEKNTLAISHLSSENGNQHNLLGLRYTIEFNEDESLTPLYTADSEELVIELVLNGADPNKESKRFSVTPLQQQFSLRYEQNEVLNGIKIAELNIEDELKNNPPKALKAEFKNQAKALKKEIKVIKLELEKNEKLIKAHMRAIILKDPKADPSTYPDISHSEKYRQVWSHYQQEIESMKQKQLSTDYTVYNFLTDPLEKISVIPMKIGESVIAKFPHYKRELGMQKDMLANYCLVQGSFQETKPIPILTTMATTDLSQLLQDSSMDVRQDRSTEKRELNKESDTRKWHFHELKEEPIQKKSSSRLAHGAFFNGMKHAVKRKDVTEEERTSVPRSSRLHQSNLFFHAPEVIADVSRERLLGKHKNALLKKRVS